MVLGFGFVFYFFVTGMQKINLWGKSVYLIILPTCLHEESKVWPFPLPSYMLHTSFLCTALPMGRWINTFPVQSLPVACLMLRLRISSGDISLHRKRWMNRHECLSVDLQMQHAPMEKGFYSLAMLSKLPGFSVIYLFLP